MVITVIFSSCHGWRSADVQIYSHSNKCRFEPLSFLINPWFICALSVYALTTVGWVWVLRKVELNRAYPFMAVAYILVPFGSWIIFKESISLKYVAGMVLILTGIVLTQSV